MQQRNAEWGRRRGQPCGDIAVERRSGLRSASSTKPTAAAFTIAHGRSVGMTRAIASTFSMSSSGRPTARAVNPRRAACSARSRATRPFRPAMRIGLELTITQGSQRKRIANGE
jgi:hypothetical protein